MPYEPCLCGAPDCPRCFPATWRRERYLQAYEEENGFRPETVEQWNEFVRWENERRAEDAICVAEAAYENWLNR